MLDRGTGARAAGPGLRAAPAIQELRRGRPSLKFEEAQRRLAVAGLGELGVLGDERLVLRVHLGADRHLRVLQQLGVLEVNSVTEDVYSQQNEFKETPLHLMTSDGYFNLICYHANGKGVTVEHPLAETSFYDWVSGLDGHVIVGGDLNMDFKKMGNELSALLDIGNISNGAFSCYKQRSPLQAQYDKAGVFDTKFCDYIITKGFIRTEVQVLAASSDGNIQQLNAEHNLSPDELVIPNNNYPFEHYIVIDHIVPIYSGFTFFSRNLPSLSWIDSMMNWALGY